MGVRPPRARTAAKRTGGVEIIERRGLRSGRFPHPAQASPGPPSPQGGGRRAERCILPSLPLMGRVSAKRTGGVEIIKRRGLRSGRFPHPAQAWPAPPSPQGGGRRTERCILPSLPLRGRVSAKRTGGVEIIKRRVCGAVAAPTRPRLRLPHPPHKGEGEELSAALRGCSSRNPASAEKLPNRSQRLARNLAQSIRPARAWGSLQAWSKQTARAPSGRFMPLTGRRSINDGGRARVKLRSPRPLTSRRTQ